MTFAIFTFILSVKCNGGKPDRWENIINVGVKHVVCVWGVRVRIPLIPSK
jgi:hypothetical protein